MDQPDQAIPQQPSTPQVQVPMPQPAFIPPLDPPNPLVPPQNFDSDSLNKRKMILVPLITFVFLFIFLMGGGIAYGVAYSNLKLGNPKLENTIRNIVFSIPFLPKTPQYILVNSIQAHQEVSKHNFDISIALDSESMKSLTGSNSFDAVAKGYVDYSDPKKIVSDFNINAKNLLDMSIKTKNLVSYLKINQLPSFFALFIPTENPEVKKILENWITYDLKPAETAAREYNDSVKEESESITQSAINEMLDLFSDKELTKAMSMSSEKIGDEQMHVLKLVATDAVVDHMYDVYKERSIAEYEKKYGAKRAQEMRKAYDSSKTKTSDTLKDVKATLWISKKTYLMHKSFYSGRITNDPSRDAYSSAYLPLSSFDKDILFTFVMQFSDFGKVVDVEIPSNTMTTEEFFSALGALQGDIYGSPYLELDDADLPESTVERSRDAQRLKDVSTVQSVLEQYIADYPDAFKSGKTFTSKAGNPSCGADGWLAKGLGINDDTLCDYAREIKVDPSNALGTYVKGDKTTASGDLIYKVVVLPQLLYRICARQESESGAERLTADGGLSGSWFEVYNSVSAGSCD